VHDAVIHPLPDVASGLRAVPVTYAIPIFRIAPLWGTDDEDGGRHEKTLRCPVWGRPAKRYVVTGTLALTSLVGDVTLRRAFTTALLDKGLEASGPYKQIGP
jgi:hypothetical protein